MSEIKVDLFMLSATSRDAFVAALMTVYFVYVRSVWQYGILAWGGVLLTILEPLEIIQNGKKIKILNFADF